MWFPNYSVVRLGDIPFVICLHYGILISHCVCPPQCYSPPPKLIRLQYGILFSEDLINMLLDLQQDYCTIIDQKKPGHVHLSHADGYL